MAELLGALASVGPAAGAIGTIASLFNLAQIPDGDQVAMGVAASRAQGAAAAGGVAVTALPAPPSSTAALPAYVNSMAMLDEAATRVTGQAVDNVITAINADPNPTPGEDVIDVASTLANESVSAKVRSDLAQAANVAAAVNVPVVTAPEVLPSVQANMGGAPPSDGASGVRAGLSVNGSGLWALPDGTEDVSGVGFAQFSSPAGQTILTKKGAFTLHPEVQYNEVTAWNTATGTYNVLTLVDGTWPSVVVFSGGASGNTAAMNIEHAPGIYRTTSGRVNRPILLNMQARPVDTSGVFTSACDGILRTFTATREAALAFFDPAGGRAGGHTRVKIRSTDANGVLSTTHPWTSTLNHESKIQLRGRVSPVLGTAGTLIVCVAYGVGGDADCVIQRIPPISELPAKWTHHALDVQLSVSDTDFWYGVFVAYDGTASAHANQSYDPIGFRPIRVTYEFYLRERPNQVQISMGTVASQTWAGLPVPVPAERGGVFAPNGRFASAANTPLRLAKVDERTRSVRLQSALTDDTKIPAMLQTMLGTKYPPSVLNTVCLTGLGFFANPGSRSVGMEKLQAIMAILSDFDSRAEFEADTTAVSTLVRWADQEAGLAFDIEAFIDDFFGSAGATGAAKRTAWLAANNYTGNTTRFARPTSLVEDVFDKIESLVMAAITASNVPGSKAGKTMTALVA